MVIHAQDDGEVTRAAAEALTRLFAAPAAVLIENDQRLAPAALAGGAKLSAADEEAARGCLSSDIAIRGEDYPYQRAAFDFWPVASPGHARFVLGVDFTERRQDGRPADSGKLVEQVAGYLAVALASPRGASRAGRSDSL